MAWSGGGERSLPAQAAAPAPSHILDTYRQGRLDCLVGMVIKVNRLRAYYSKGSINFMKTAFFRVPSILWAMLPCLSMITVVGTTAMLP